MRLGIVTDVHDEVHRLGEALARFAELGVDRILSLGDLADSFTPGDAGAEAARLLARAGAVGVWGNHDFGMSFEVHDSLRRSADPVALGFTSKLRAFLCLGECRFSHVEPDRDATSVVDLWLDRGVPDTPEGAAAGFAAVPERLLFVGHFHRWFAVTPHAAVPWDGSRSLDLSPPSRYLVGIGAVCDGCCAVLDTARHVLEPVRLA